MESLSVLILDDEQRVLDEIEEFLKNKDYSVYTSRDVDHAYGLFEKENIDILILDVKLPGVDGLDVLEKIKTAYPETEVIMISGHGDMDTVIKAMRKGAVDYFPKPFRLIDINNSILRTKRFVELNKKLKTAEANIDLLSKKLLDNIGGRLLGVSPAIKRLKEMMVKVAATDNTSVLILGESGTGKELVAQGIHYLSERSKSPFYSVNCSAIPEGLFESEFFGHKKGSFTGAMEDKQGWFEIANSGTLFLDEISDMPILQQAKLLRVLEERKVSKVGSHKMQDVNVRVIAASNKHLEDMANENKFRLDLFHRLSIFVIEIPPLRERREDIPVLMEFYMNQYANMLQKEITGMDEGVYEMFNNNPLPGNVRQLKNCIERAVILCEGDTLLPEYFRIAGKQDADIPSPSGYYDDLDEMMDLESHERQLIMKALEKADNNKAKAASILNITWQSLDRRMKKFGLEG
jgi:DNA-binding NtrC family response regulator